MGIVHPSEVDFDRLLEKTPVVLVDFWATWCGPCQMVAPSLEKIAKQYEGRAVVAKVDIEEWETLAVRYDVMSIPTVIVFKDGKAVQTEVGVRSQAIYEKMIEDQL